MGARFSCGKRLVFVGALVGGCAARCPEPAAASTPEPASASQGSSAEAVDAEEQARRGRSGKVLHGKATYYADSLAGNKTASGDRYNPRALTAAHRTLPFGTRVRVTRKDTGDAVIVKINDRGPYAGGGRIIDVSRAAAEKLKMIRAGVIEVRVEVLP